MTIRILLNKLKLSVAKKSTKKSNKKFKTQRARKMKRRTSLIKWKIKSNQAATTKINIAIIIPYRSITRNPPITIIINIEEEVGLKAPKIKKL